MPYLGNTPADKYSSYSVQHFTTSATTSYTLDFPVANENEIELFINNVRQEPGSSYAYTASGTSLTLSAATSASDTMYCVFQGKSTQTVTPATGSVTNAMLSSGSFSNITGTGTLTNFTSTGIDDNATSTAVTIDSSQNVLVGQTSRDYNSNGVNINPTGYSHFTSTSYPLLVNRKSTDGEIVNLYRDATKIGNIGSFSSLPYFAGSSYGILIGSGNVVPSTNTGAISNNSMDLGASNRKFKDGYFGGYVYSDNTANAWVHFNGTGTVAIKDDFNVSSITDSGTGNYFINYSSNLANTTYSFAMSSARNSATQYCVTTLEDIQVSGFRVHNANFGSALVDNAYISLMVIGG